MPGCFEDVCKKGQERLVCLALYRWRSQADLKAVAQYPFDTISVSPRDYPQAQLHAIGCLFDPAHFCSGENVVSVASYPVNLFINTLQSDPYHFLSWVLIVTFSICFHEFAHASAALKEGDSTAADLGHLSMNPLVQMGWSSLIMLCLIGIAWGAVPVDIRRMRSRASGAIVALAGPAANLLLCSITAGLVVLCDAMGADEMIVKFFYLASAANGVLFLFNMLPIPMFDGWPVLSLFFPQMQRLNPANAQTVSLVFLVLVWTTQLGTLVWAGGAGISIYFTEAWDALGSLITG